MFKIFNRHNNFQPSRYTGVEETNKRYQHYLETTTDNYMAQRGDVFVKDPHTMPGDAYKELRDSIDSISLLAKSADKQVIFEDARHLYDGVEFVSEEMKNDLAKKVLVSVTDKQTGDASAKTVDYFDNGENNTSFLARVFSTLNGMFSSESK